MESEAYDKGISTAWMLASRNTHAKVEAAAPLAHLMKLSRSSATAERHHPSLPSASDQMRERRRPAKNCLSVEFESCKRSKYLKITSLMRAGGAPEALLQLTYIVNMTTKPRQSEKARAPQVHRRSAAVSRQVLVRDGEVAMLFGPHDICPTCGGACSNGNLLWAAGEGLGVLQRSVRIPEGVIVCVDAPCGAPRRKKPPVSNVVHPL